MENYEDPEHIKLAQEYANKAPVDMNIDLKSHRCNPITEEEIRYRIESYFRFYCDSEEIMKTKFDEVFIQENTKRISLDLSAHCFNCGERINLSISTNGKLVLRVFSGSIKDGFVPLQECLEKDGPVEFNIIVPSGKIIVANHFRQNEKYDLFSLPEYENRKYTTEFSLQSNLGMRNCMQTKAKVLNLADVHIGNCSCVVYKETSESFVVGAGDLELENTTLIKVAKVCTDYWGYYMTDWNQELEDFLKSEDLEYTIVECTPGTYKFHHTYHMTEDASNIYTTIKKI